MGIEKGRGHRAAGGADGDLNGLSLPSSNLPWAAEAHISFSGTAGIGGQETCPLPWLYRQLVRDWASTPPPLGLSFFLCKGVTDACVLLHGPLQLGLHMSPGR